MNARRVLLPVLTLATAAAIWVSVKGLGPSEIPAATWRMGKGTDFRQAENYAEIQAGTALRLSFVGNVAHHVYVFSHSAEDGTLLMFPSPKVKSDAGNPLPEGRTVLPGKRGEETLYWGLRDGVLATTTYITIASKQPIAELEALLPNLRRWTNTALQDQTMNVTNPDPGHDVQGKPRTPLPSPLLQRAAELSLTATLINGPMHADKTLPDVWVSSWRAKEKK